MKKWTLANKPAKVGHSDQINNESIVFDLGYTYQIWSQFDFLLQNVPMLTDKQTNGRYWTI